MKKTVLVIALVAMLVFAGATMAMAKNAGSPAIVGDNTTKATSSVNATSGYVYWTAAERIASIDPMEGDGPHGNYTATTIKCAVCHSVHGAKAGGDVLLPFDAQGGSATCLYCHSSGSTVVGTGAQVSLNIDPANNTPHSGCNGYCHSQSVHGAGVSEYKALKAKLLINAADTRIGGAITGANGVNSGMTLSLMNSVTNFDAVTLGTGYVCSRAGCHSNDGSAFSIAGSGNTMYTQGPDAKLHTGHPVLAKATTTWSSGAHGVTTAETTIAWADANRCNACHDLVDPVTGKKAFPHNRIGTRLWMTFADSVGGASFTTSDNAIGAAAAIPSTLASSNLDWYPTSIDGACLKCHINTIKTAGVGITY